MISNLRVSLVQFDIFWEQSERNLYKLEEMFIPLKGNTDLILLPEMFSTGFTMNAHALAENMDGPTIKWLTQQAKNLNSDIAASLVLKENGLFYNRMVWVNKDGIQSTYDKRHLFTLAGENRIYEQGKAQETVHFRDWKIFPQICYDLRFPVWSRNQNDYDLVFYLANWPDKRRLHWKHLLLARAIENQAYVIGLNRIGWDGEQHFYTGDSLVVDPNGNVIADLGDQEIIKTITLDHHEIETTRYHLPFLKDRDQFEIRNGS